MRPLRSPTLAALVACCLTSSVLAALSNITVDDTGAAIQYSPLSAWNGGSICSVCRATPDVTKAHGGTWHDSTHREGSDQPTFASLEFTGSAVYVFCIIPHASTPFIGASDMTFFLDGEQVGNFALAPNGSNVYDYNVPVYVNASVPPGKHTIVLQNGTPNAPLSMVLLDYIVYTAEQAESTSSFMSTSMSQSQSQSQSSYSPSSISPSSSSPASASSSRKTVNVIAAVIPSVVALLVAAGAILFFLKRRTRQQGHYDPPDAARYIGTSGVGSQVYAPVSMFPYGDASVDPLVAATRGHEFYHGAEQQAVPVTLSKAARAGLVAAPPVSSASRGSPGVRPLPTSNMQPGAARLQRSTTLLSAPPAYDEISRYGADHS